MTGVPFALAATPGASADPTSLALHLDICRLHAELEHLEARIDELGATTPPAEGEVVAPFAERAEELVERMVGSLLQAGRDEIEAGTNRRMREAEARLHEAARRADGIVERARAEVDAALLERGRRALDARVSGLDLVALADGELRLASAGLEAGPPAGPIAATLSAPSIPPPAPVVPSPAPRRVPVVPSVASPAAGSAPAVAPASPAEPDLDGSGRVSSRAVQAEEARTDAAFDAWMAVAPARPNEGEVVASTVDTVPEPVLLGTGSRGRSRWVMPLEVVCALLAAAILVVVILLVIG